MRDPAPSSRIRYAAVAIIGSEITSTTVATAFTSGRFWLLRNAPRIHNGSVVVSAPARKKVTAISSNDRASANSAPAISAVRIEGKVTRRNVWKPLAPRSRDASSSEGDSRRNRASTLLNTSTMQNDVWQITTVRTDSAVCVKRKNDASATPVSTPGRMIGSVTAKFTTSRPKKRKRANANAMPVPSRTAKTVEKRATLTDSQAAFFGAGSCQSLTNQRVEKPGNGHELMVVLLNA